MFSGLRTLLFFTGAALAAGFYGNQSHIDWKTAGTEHFQFIYPAEYSEHASAVATYAEAVYDSVVNRYNKPLPRISAVLNNALFSNGAAIPAENSINLWLTNWDFKIRSSHGWVADVAAGTKAAITSYDWLGLLLISFIIPAVLSPLINAGCSRLGWVREGDMKL